jgi:hypothetical protein
MPTPFRCSNCRRQYKHVRFPFRCVCSVTHTSEQQSLPIKRSSMDLPGTELAALLSQFGITEKTSCTCRGVKAKMDYWGIDGCEQPQNRQWIIEQLQANAAKYSWGETLSAAASVVVNPSQWLTALRLNPLSMAESLLDEALRRAKAKSEAT